MTERQIKLVIGSLLHDIGKVVYRSGDGRNHSESGYSYLKESAGIADEEILHCVRYHHGCHIAGAKIAKDDLAYLTYYADNVAAFSDRRKDPEGEPGFDRTVPLSSIFNLLNGNQEKQHFRPQVLKKDKEINYPTKEPVTMDENFYGEIVRGVTDNLRGISLSEEYLNSLLTVMEANLSYIPSSTSKKEFADISLYDHVKMTAAIAQCVDAYLRAAGISDYRRELFDNKEASYQKKMFLLYTLDLSGIQSFIYTIASQGAVRGLRARSFYLEILMEHIVDELLDRMGMSRANLVYSGGGRSLLLLPDTEQSRKLLEQNEKEINGWLQERFGTALYLAGGYVSCSANNLRNEPKGSYSQLFAEMSRAMSQKKMHRYSAEEIRRLNRRGHEGDRECCVCRRMERLDEAGRCSFCSALHRMSGSILYEDFFLVLNQPETDALPLPQDRYLIACAKDEAVDRMKKDSYVRCYSKNDVFTGRHVTTKLWVGDYTTGDSFQELAEKARGISRLAVLRADVDNLGKTFVHGFEREGGDDSYVTISRTATLSRQLSLFFKNYINRILAEGDSKRVSPGGARNVTIVYSGGDDVFLVGAWNEVIDAFVDLREAFRRFTQGTLTISGGVGLYRPGFPARVMARETAVLEDLSKNMDGKDAVTVFDERGTYSWAVFLRDVLDDKYRVIQEFFDETDEYGRTFLYHLLELLQDEEGDEEEDEAGRINARMNTARFVYLLSRMEPARESDERIKKKYREFSMKMYQWRRNKEDCRQAVTAICLYVYLTRRKETK